MANYDDEDFDNLEDNEPEAVEAEAAEGEARPASNRNFLLALGILGGLFLLLVIALVVVALLFLPRERARREATNAVISTQNAATAQAATEGAIIAMQLLTPSASPTITQTAVPPTPTNTLVVAVPTNTNAPTEAAAAQDTPAVEARTATVAALLTQAAGGGAPGAETPGAGVTPGPGTPAAGTPTAGTPGSGGGIATATRLPDGGFADDVGLPGLFGLALGLTVVIALVRRLRLSTNS